MKQGFLILVVSLPLAASPLAGLVIYRFGGQDLPPPVEEGSQGVEVVSFDWTDLDPALGGLADELSLSPETIGILKRDPAFNIAPTVEEHGGEHLAAHKNGEVWDGDSGTIWLSGRYLCAEFAASSWFKCHGIFGTPGTASLDLGAHFQIDRVRIISGLHDPGKTVQSLAVHLSPTLPRGLGSGQPIGVYAPLIAEVRDNREQILDVEIPTEEQARFLQVIVGEHNDDWEVHEIEVYARGFVSKSTYVSNILSFGQPMAWGDLRWSGSEGASPVLIQTRSGTDPTPEKYFLYTGRGQEKEVVTLPEYGKASVGQKAGVGYDQEHWSFWSAPYDYADSTGTPVVSPGPRSHLQIRVDFIPDGERGEQLHFLELRASEPVATALAGEVWPVEARAGQVRTFTYVVKPTLLGDDGFDRLEIRSLARLGSVLGIRRGDERSLSWNVEAAGEHRLVAALSPRLDAGDSGSAIEIDFEAQVLRYGTTFDVRAWDSSRPLEVPQSVTPGDATGDFEGNRVSVATFDQGRSLLRVNAGTGVLTPNGDGANEAATLVYEIMEITATAQLRAEIHDLSGRHVRLLGEARQEIGRYALSWDGRDDSGRLLPPGIYLYRVAIATDGDTVANTGLLHLVY